MSTEESVWVALPRAVLALAYRIMALPPGVFTIQVIKTEGGGAGLVGWVVTEAGKLEMPEATKKPGA